LRDWSAIGLLSWQIRTEAVYEAFSAAVIGLAEAVLCITRNMARQQPAMGWLASADWIV
jgi:hypothetical protein